MNDGLDKALSKGYADVSQQQEAAEIIDKLEAEVARLRRELDWYTDSRWEG
jgi:hypothetical protein